ncbi:cone cGMP-specific 3',5'-cyclic phosphodiesterase subunit alpha' [Platysternon megacephalum]|uniref:Cone cGMP-specific 3',5'-cyclic phosphodiesterase subunit alpha n=1 Tax=Platysternon megacephalum TaxID=55544 RepID=A0A4D9ELU4_9SAUR|nr:cone cGMP-specific 3',5'-cyclic phosphodiesterase subunit alpha' [Platysternon megacephalum]
MLLTDPEIESSLLISSDEGATYQKYRLNFYIQSLLFHPKQEDWILAYSLDQKVRKDFVSFTNDVSFSLPRA